MKAEMDQKNIEVADLEKGINQIRNQIGQLREELGELMYNRGSLNKMEQNELNKLNEDLKVIYY